MLCSDEFVRSKGLTPEGTAEKFIADGDNTYGGRVVTNPSGGLLSKGQLAMKIVKRTPELPLRA